MTGKLSIENYNMDSFDKFMRTNPTDDGVFAWFSRMNKVYKKEKKEGNITDDVMMEIVSFWRDVTARFGPVLYDVMEERWGDKPPVLISDIVAFAPKFNEILYQRCIEKMDEVEKAETETLFNAIWNKNCRFEGTFSYYDWDEDAFESNGLEVPRKDRDNYKFDFKRICANIIYNRGDMYLKFYSGRGRFEVAGIHVGDGRGVWECLSKAEMMSSYSDDAGNPMTFEDNETVILLDHPEQEEGDNVIIFRK